MHRAVLFGGVPLNYLSRCFRGRGVVFFNPQGSIVVFAVFRFLFIFSCLFCKTGDCVFLILGRRLFSVAKGPFLGTA